MAYHCIVSGKEQNVLLFHVRFIYEKCSSDGTFQLLKLFDLLDRAGIIRQVFTGINSPKSLAKPQKILLDNSTLMCALGSPLIGAQRECTFASFLSVGHRVGFAKDGDFIVDSRYLFEIGGKGKGFAQIRDIPDSFVASDDIEFGFGNKIPLWLFGFLY